MSPSCWRGPCGVHPRESPWEVTLGGWWEELRITPWVDIPTRTPHPEDGHTTQQEKQRNSECRHGRHMPPWGREAAAQETREGEEGGRDTRAGEDPGERGDMMGR